MKNKKRILSFKYFLFDFTRISGAIPALLALRPKRLYISDVAKKKIKGGAVLASNHTGFFDIIFLMTTVWYRRLHFVTITKLFEKPLSRFWFKHVGQCIAIDRDNPGMGAMRTIVSHLKNEEVVAIFPEGHINESETLDEFKSGTALMAIMSGKPIVPVYILKRKNVFERLKVAFGEPIYVDEQERAKSPLEYRKALSQLVYDKEKELQMFCERKYGKRN